MVCWRVLFELFEEVEEVFAMLVDVESVEDELLEAVEVVWDW